MFVPCESLMKSILPAMRAAAIKELSEKYKLNQVEIAKRLGLTQAAVSKYLSGKYGRKIKEFEKNEKLQKLSREIASVVAKRDDETTPTNCFTCPSLSGADCLIRHLTMELIAGRKKGKITA